MNSIKSNMLAHVARRVAGYENRKAGDLISRGLAKLLVLLGIHAFLIGAVQAQTVEYIHTDALGSPVVVTDANRNVLERSEYEPFGRVLAPAAPKDGPGYTGHVFDSASGMNYMQQRYYDPSIGRFLSVDPVTAYEMPLTNFNRYWYANNNPYRNIDPDGRLCADAKSGGQCVDVSDTSKQAAGRVTALASPETDAAAKSGSAISKISSEYGEKNYALSEVSTSDGGSKIVVVPLKSSDSSNSKTAGATSPSQTVKGEVKALAHPHPTKEAGIPPGPGDHKNIRQNMPTYIYNGKRVGVLEASSGTYHYRMVQGKLTETEVEKTQAQLDAY